MVNDSPNTAYTTALAAELRIALGRLVRKLREHSRSGDLTPSQRAVLIHLEREGPTTVTGLARAEGVRPQSMGATVAALEAARHVAGVSDPSDGRQTLISLTDDSREMLLAGRAAREDWLFHGLDIFSPAERDQLAVAIPLLRRLADSPFYQRKTP